MNITSPPSPTTAPIGVGNYGRSLTAGNHAPGSADALASQLIEKNTSPLGFFGQARQLDTASLANQIVALSQKDSAKAADVLAAVEQQLSPSNFGDFQADLRTAREQLNSGIATLKGNFGTDHSMVDKDAARNLAAQLVQDASTEQASAGNSQSPADIDTSKLAFRLEKLAEADPAEAQAVKAALNELLPLDQLAALNEDLGGGRGLTERLALIVESPGDAAVGIGKGMATDASDDTEFKLKVLTNLVGTELQVDSMLMKGRDPEASAALMQQAEAMYRKTDGIDLPAPEIKNGAEAGGRDLASMADTVTGNLTSLAKGKTLDGLSPETKPEALQQMQEALRYRQLSWNHEQKKFSVIEAHGVSRAEQALGRRFEPSNIEGVDFLDPTGLGKISLKGPFLDKNLQPLKLEYQERAAENILKHVEANKAVDVHIIDTKGLTDEVFEAMQEILKNSPTKILFLR